MKHGTIVIAGPIGDFEINGKKINGVNLVDVVSSVNALGDISELVIQITSVGGRKDVGDHIYNYLSSLKPKVKIITEQIGIVASIGTKIFGVGDERIALQGEEFMIHNPWTVAMGDSSKLEAVAAELKEIESELLSFYQTLTGVPQEGLKPLLDAETTFNAETALKLKFATSIKQPLKAVAMKLEAKKKMNALFAQFLSYLSQEPVLNLAVELEGGGSINFATEDASKLDGVDAVMINADGSQVPAPNGDYKLKDGRTVTVTDGKVSAVAGGAPAPSETELEAQVEAVLNANLEKLTNALQANATAQSAMESRIMQTIDTKFDELRSQIKTKHTPMGYKPESHGDLVKEWDRSFKANEHKEMRKNDPEKYKLLYYAKFGRQPNI